MMTFPVSLVRKSQKYRSSNSNKTQNIGHMGVQIKLVSPKIYHFSYENGIPKYGFGVSPILRFAYIKHFEQVFWEVPVPMSFWTQGCNCRAVCNFFVYTHVRSLAGDIKWDKFMQNPPQTHCFPLQIFACFTTLKCMSLNPLRSTFPPSSNSIHIFVEWVFPLTFLSSSHRCIHPFLRPAIPRWGEVDVRSYLTPTLDPQTQDASGKWKFIDL